MMHQLLQLLPNWLTQTLTLVLVWGVVVGVILSLVGARFSRAMLTLLAVTAGSWIGVRLPAMFGWTIDAHAVGVCGAIILGTAAFLFHRTLIGIGLGLVMALWAITAAWIRFNGPDQWHPPDLHWTGSMVTWLAQLWQSFPGQLGMVLPYACGAGLAGGVLIAVLWPRIGRCLLYSLLGSTLIVAGGLPLAARLRPDWLELTPASSQAQLLILSAVVAMGMAVQWFVTRQPRKRPSPRREPAGGWSWRKSTITRRTLGQLAPAVSVR